VTGWNFDPIQSLTLMVVVAIVAGGEPWYALIAALLVGLLPVYFTSQTATERAPDRLRLGRGPLLARAWRRRCRRRWSA
jgi:predicted membrane protein